MAKTDGAWPDGLFDYRTVSPSQVTQTAAAAVAAAEVLIAQAGAAAEANDHPAFDDVVGRIDRAEGDVWEAQGRSAFMLQVHPDPDVRAACQAAEERMTSWRQDLPLRDDIAAAIERYARSPESASLEGEQRRLHDRWLRDLRRAGHHLADSTRAEIRALTARIVALETTFQRNLAEWSDGIEVGRDDLVGLPDTYFERLAEGRHPGTWRISLDYPDYLPFMEASPRRELRQALATKWACRASAANRPLLEEALTLRRRKAELLGYPSWAHYRIEPKMAATPERVEALHAGIVPALQALSAIEYAAMTQRLAADTGETDLRTWDVPYYDRRIRADEHGIDAEEISAYLPLGAVIDGLLELTDDVFGLAYAEVSNARAWHAEVRLFEVLDRATDERLGWCYMDLHPRPGKFGHAMAWPIRLARRAPHGRRSGGVSVIVMNLPRSTSSGPALLTHDEVTVLFHEFGHVLHEVLGRNDRFRLSAMNLEDDFPEAISQIMENWAWEPTILERFARHHRTGTSMPVELANRLAASRNVNLGSRYLRWFGTQADFDLRIHGPEPVDLDDAMEAADAIRGLPSIVEAFWPASFGHIMAGYDAGYYGYLWSLVYGDDLWSRFRDEGIIDPLVGAAYRRDVLEPGATRDAEDLVTTFLGRPSTNESFMSRTGIGAAAARTG